MSLEEERYRAAVGDHAYRTRNVSRSLSQFIIVLVALAVAVAWIRSRPDSPGLWPEMRILFISVTILLGVQATARIATDLVGSWNSRMTQTALTRGVVPAPKFPRSFLQESVFLLIVVAATLGSVALVYSLR
jgi:hypothetical protein